MCLACLGEKAPKIYSVFRENPESGSVCWTFVAAAAAIEKPISAEIVLRLELASTHVVQFLAGCSKQVKMWSTSWFDGGSCGRILGPIAASMCICGRILDPSAASKCTYSRILGPIVESSTHVVEFLVIAVSKHRCGRILDPNTASECTYNRILDPIVESKHT